MHVCRNGFAFDGRGSAWWACSHRVHLAERQVLPRDELPLARRARRKMPDILPQFRVGLLGEARRPMEPVTRGGLAHS